MALAGFAAGGAWIAIAGWLRFYRGINETIASLLLAYIALAIMNHLVEGVMRDPAATNKAATYGIGAENMLSPVPWLGVPWGLVYGVVLCLALYVLIERTTMVVVWEKPGWKLPEMMNGTVYTPRPARTIASRCVTTSWPCCF
jgi:simple sugar transport system permease protein